MTAAQAGRGRGWRGSSHPSWWITTLVAAVISFFLLMAAFGLMILDSWGSDGCMSCGCPDPNQYFAGWIWVLRLGLPAAAGSLLVPHGPRWLLLRIPLLLTVIAACALPVIGGWHDSTHLTCPGY